MKSHFEEMAEPILIRTTSDIGVATMKILNIPEYSAYELSQISRMAFYHRVQVDLWTKFSKKYNDLTAIIICTFGSACAPEVAVFFNDGEKIRKVADKEYACESDLDIMVQDCIWEHEEKK